MVANFVIDIGMHSTHESVRINSKKIIYKNVMTLIIVNTSISFFPHDMISQSKVTKVTPRVTYKLM